MLGKTKVSLHETMRRRANLAIFLVMIGFVVLIARLFWIQCLNDEIYQKRGTGQHWKKQQLLGTRGAIRARNGELMAVSNVGYSCYADPKMIEKPQQVARELAPLLGMQEEAVIARLSRRKRRFVWLKRQLSKELADEIKQRKFTGIGFQRESKRDYPNDYTAAHILGFVGLDHKGLEGIEASFEPELHGKDGYLWRQVDGRMARNGIYIEGAPEQMPTRGADVYLTIDLDIQSIVEDELTQLAAKFRPITASAVVMPVKSGEVVAMASHPWFDPNDYRSYPTKTWQNPAVSNAYEMGSIMKPFIIAASLQENLVTPETIFFCHNGAYRNPAARRTLHDHHRHGNLTVEEIIVKSSNIGTALVAERLGIDKLHDYFSQVGFGQKTQVFLPSESRGILKPARRWTASTMMSVPMGHEVSLTVLQMAAAFNALIGDGVYRTPYIVDKVVYPDGRVLDRHQTLAKRRVFPMHVVQTTRRMLRRVVEEGTARRANIKGVCVGGKTGTAQKVIDGRYSHSKHVASFVGFAPADNPLYCCIITVDEPKGSQFGGTVAAPYVAKILQRAILLRRISR